MHDASNNLDSSCGKSRRVSVSKKSSRPRSSTRTMKVKEIGEGGVVLSVNLL